jgi:hypothetical protein
MTFVRLIPFKDHINVEAKAVLSHTDELLPYKVTPKGRPQMRHDQQVLHELLKAVLENLK